MGRATAECRRGRKGPIGEMGRENTIVENKGEGGEEGKRLLGERNWGSERSKEEDEGETGRGKRWKMRTVRGRSGYNGEEEGGVRCSCTGEGR